MPGISEAHRLYRLQTVDVEIEQLDKRKSDTESQIGESEALLHARSGLEDARLRLHREESRVRELELDVQTTSDKLTQVQAKLYGGSVKASKELSALQRESEILQQSKGRSEDQLLESMSAIETLQAEVVDAERTWAEIEAAWKAEQASLSSQLQDLQGEIASAGSARAGLAAAFSASTLGEYERLRLIRKGRAVVRIERNACMGCRIGLPMSVVQQTRSSQALVFCPSCGRILCGDR